MYITSAAFRRSVLTSHQVIAGADLYPTSGLPIYGLPVTDGSVKIDSTASERRTLNLDLASIDLIPSEAFDPAAPYGAELRPWRGIRYPDGSSDVLPLGVFRITDADVNDDGTPTLSIVASDRSHAVSRNKFVDPWIIAAGQNYADAIGSLVLDRLPGIDLNLADTAEKTPLLVYDTEDDPWAHLLEMAKAIGHECFFDADGVFVLRPQPDPSDDQPVAEFVEGEGSVLLSVRRSLSDDPGYNGVVMTAESTTLPAPIRSVLWDNDARSPTFYLGPYGKVPAFQSSPYIASQSGADAAARAWLVKNMGGTNSVALTAIPNPALDASDVVLVQRALSKIDQTGIVESITMPLAVDKAMDVNLRTRQTLVGS